jgi:hypothetical protein
VTARRPCLTCGKPSNGSYCPTHKKADDHRRNAKTVAHGVKKAHFQRVRRQVLAATGGLCELRHRGCTNAATTVHLDPELEGNHDLATVENCKAACSHCHGVEDGGRAAASRRIAA